MPRLSGAIIHNSTFKIQNSSPRIPVFELPDEHVFPRPELAREDGLLAVGGDLDPERLMLAYSLGIFPWYSHPEPILWWSPDPRCVLYPDKLKISKSMRQVLKRGTFRVTFDRDFAGVITACRAMERPGQHGTWITQEMLEAYLALHDMGVAHSVEVWNGEELAGGLYGLTLGSIFYGESMFARESNASKAGFITLVPLLARQGITLIDCQTHTPHLESLGAEMVSGEQFREELAAGMKVPSLFGDWGKLLG